MSAKPNETAAMRAYAEAQGMPIDKVLAKANKAMEDKEWMVAHILLAHVSKQAIMLSAHALKQEIALLKGAIDGQEQED